MIATPTLKRSKYQEAVEIIRELQDTTEKAFGSHAFSSGYLGSMVAELLAALPEKKRQEYLNGVNRTIQTYAQEEK